MDSSQRLQVANRIDLLLRRTLGQGVDVRRMLAEPLYLRDVLLVCDAMPGTEGPVLSRLYRTLATADAARGTGRERGGESLGGRISGWMSGFGHSTGFGPSESGRDDEPRPAGRTSRWPWFWR